MSALADPVRDAVSVAKIAHDCGVCDGLVEQAAERDQHKLAHAIVWTVCQPLISVPSRICFGAQWDAWWREQAVPPRPTVPYLPPLVPKAIETGRAAVDAVHRESHPHVVLLTRQSHTATLDGTPEAPAASTGSAETGQGDGEVSHGPVADNVVRLSEQRRYLESIG